MFWIYSLIVVGLLFGCMLAWWFRRELIPLLTLIGLALCAFGVYRLWQTQFALWIKWLGIAAFVAVVLAVPILHVVPYILGKLEEIRDFMRRALRDIHGNRDADYAPLWDTLIPITFLISFLILAYADYVLFAARIAGVLGIPTAVPVSSSLLNQTLGALYVVSLIVIGFILFDAFGHSPSGQSLTTGKIMGEWLKGVRVALLVVLGLFIVATLFLAIWTVEIAILNTSGEVPATIFLISFSLVAFAALLLAFGPALMGVAALTVPVSYLMAAALWALAGICWLALWLFDKVAAALYFALNLLARAGAYLTGRGKKAPETWEERTPVHDFAPAFPLLSLDDSSPPGAAATNVVPLPALPAVASGPSSGTVALVSTPAAQSVSRTGTAVAAPEDPPVAAPERRRALLPFGKNTRSSKT